MSDYTTEAEVSVQARQRRRRSLIVIGVVLLGLFFAFWYAWSYYQADSSARATRPPPATCAPYDPNAVTPENTKVNVYNASSRNGLAGSVSKSLAERGFVIGKVANDPSNRKPPKVAEIRYGPTGEAHAKLLRTDAAQGHDHGQGQAQGGHRRPGRGARSTRRSPPCPRRRRCRCAPRPPGPDRPPMTAPVPLGADAEARKARAVVLDPTWTASEAFVVVATECTDHWSTNARLLLESRAMPHLHQTRVGIRRLRSSFSLFGPLLRDVPGAVPRRPPAARAGPALRPGARPRRAARRAPRRRPRRARRSTG